MLLPRAMRTTCVRASVSATSALSRSLASDVSPPHARSDARSDAPPRPLARRVVLITGGARGIGAALARRLAADGAHVVLAGRSVEAPSSRKLQGTLLGTARAIAAAGGVAFVQPLDVTDAADVRRAVARVAREHGGIDVLVNNASAVDPSARPTQESMDRMHATNARGTLACNAACLPHLKERRGQILTFSPPLPGMERWLSTMPAYAMSKYGMTMATLAYAQEVRANTLWPTRSVRTAATRMLEDRSGVPYHTLGRSPDYFAAAAREVLVAAPEETGRMLLDEQVLPHAPDEAPMDAFVGDADVGGKAARAPLARR